MNKKEIIEKTKKYVQATFEKENLPGHDWWHIERVLNIATTIAKKEKGSDLFIVQLGVLLHDIADSKFNNWNEKKGGQVATIWLQSLNIDESIIKKVVHIVDNVSFKGIGVKPTIKSLEGKIVQDADRLDTLGAIGIARIFTYGGAKGRPIYNPKGKTRKHNNFEEYKKDADSTIHHAYEKILHLKKLMNTKTGVKIAIKRHKFIELYIKQFLNEWNGLK